MADLIVRTAGESHGPAVVALLEGFPAGVPVDLDRINADLARRQGGYGRGGRMQIESDTAEVLAGVRRGRTLPGPVVLVVRNRDSRLEEAPEVTRPRPGHADLAGALKYLDPDMRSILERASARETAGRVAAGGLAKCLLAAFDIDVAAWVTRIGDVTAGDVPEDLAEAVRARDASEVYCPDADATKAMMAAIDEARDAGDTLGGIVRCTATGVPAGLGGHTQWTRKLDGRLARAVMSIQAIKGVEIGLGFEAAARPGSQVHDAIAYDADEAEGPAAGFVRPTNRAGGIEGGISNGEDIVLNVYLKPLATMGKPAVSIDISTRRKDAAISERSDICAVPRAGSVAEAMTAFTLAQAMVEKFGGDHIREMKRNYDGYLASLAATD